MEWTFDPLEIKNAYFNMERLGAIVRRFVLNQYGTTSSQLHGGLPTDRCIAEWWLASPRVEAISRRRQPRAAAGRGAHLGAVRDLHDQGNRSSARARNSEARERAVPRKFFERTGGDRIRADAGSRHLPTLQHGIPNRPHRSAPDPHAAGAFLRDQLRPNV